ncbi:MAG TPA: single-stranded DNA-binding protein [Gemmataceae bacterium]|jgi:single-strand DNA-binding protein|nr:single-stranded DNA-binding protein [Gemmataceae bacterium]
MANLNKVMLIGRLTRDPEIRTFGNGGKVANFGFAVNNRRKNTSTGQWEDDPVFIDMAVFNRGETGRQADLAEQSLRKGHQVFIDGHLKLDQWTSQDGQKRSKLSVVVDNFQFLEPRSEGSGGSSSRRPVQGNVPPAGGDFEHASEFDPPTSGGDEGIPF